MPAGRNVVFPLHPSSMFGDNTLEFAVFEATKTFRNVDIVTVFPEAAAVAHQPMYCIVTFQKAEFEESAISDPPASSSSLIGDNASTREFKDISRERFFSFMRAVKDLVLEKMEGASASGEGSVWADWTDPATGMPFLGAPGASTYCESDAIQQLMPCDVVLVAGSGGGCSMISHPRWGLEVYPATGFISVPSFEVLENALLQVV